MPCKQFPQNTLAAKQSVLRLLCPFSIMFPNPRVRQVDTEPCHQPRTTGSCILLQAASALHPWSGVCSTTAAHPSQRQPGFHQVWNTSHVTGDWGEPTPAFLLGTLYTQMNLSGHSQGTQQSRWWKKTQKHRQHLPQPMCYYQNRNLTKHGDLKRQREQESQEAAKDHGHPVCGLVLHIPPSSQLCLNHLPRVQLIPVDFQEIWILKQDVL